MPRCVFVDEIPLPYLPFSSDLRKLHPQNGKSVEVAMELSEHNPGVSSPPISSILTLFGSPLSVIVPIAKIMWRIFFDHCFLDQ